MFPILRKQALKIRHVILRNASKIRVAELAAGRSAVVGLVSTATIGNLYGVSLLSQYAMEKPFVISVVAAISLYTCYKSPGMEVEYEENKVEINAGRQAMVVMVLLAALEQSHVF